MSALGNVVWVVFGGFFGALAWAFAGCLMFVSVVGIPWGRACFNMASLALLPFGREAIRRDEMTGEKDVGTGTMGTIGNVVWFVLGGAWLGLMHAFAGLAYCLTVIGIPFGIAHFKLGGLALAPIGKTIVPTAVAEAARARNAEEAVTRARAG